MVRAEPPGAGKLFGDDILSIRPEHTGTRLSQLKTRSQTFGENVLDGVKGSRNSALIGAGFNTVTALYQGKDAKGVVTDAAIGAGTGVADEVIQKTINGARSTTVGMTESTFRTAVSQVKGAAVAGAIINTGFAVYDQWDNVQNDATRSQAVGTITGEAVSKTRNRISRSEKSNAI